MRATSVLRILLALQSTYVTAFEFSSEGITIDVRPSWRRHRCSGCGRACTAYDRRARLWRHLDLGGVRCDLRYELVRVDCRSCGVKVETVPWAEPASRYTLPFEGHTAYLVQRCDRTTVSNLMRVAWHTVGTIIKRFTRRQRDASPDPLDGLRSIGIDELSYRKHHKYVTTVVDHDTGKVVWAAEGKSAATLKTFFDELGEARCAELKTVSIDLSGAYIKAVSEAVPQAKLVFDRFHVQALAQKAVDEVRRSEVRNAESKDKKALKKTRNALLKSPWNLTSIEQDKLSELERVNKPIYRAYLLKESLAAILDGRQIHVASRKLDEWLAWARRSQLAPFTKLAKTIALRRDGILEYVRTRLTNGRVEGLNGKARTITRRAYGFHCASSLIAMLFLCCGGIDAYPAHIFPFWTH